jgi:hypothetical protein
MPIRSIGGELGKPLVVALNVVSTHQDEIAVGDMVVVDTSGNFTCNSTAATTNVNYCGKVLALNPGSTVATVQLYGYNKAFEATYSASIALGQQVVTDTSGKVKGSGNAASTAATNRKLNICVAKDFPSSGKCVWFSV